MSGENPRLANLLQRIQKLSSQLKNPTAAETPDQPASSTPTLPVPAPPADVAPVATTPPTATPMPATTPTPAALNEETPHGTVASVSASRPALAKAPTVAAQVEAPTHASEISVDSSPAASAVTQPPTAPSLPPAAQTPPSDASDQPVIPATKASATPTEAVVAELPSKKSPNASENQAEAVASSSRRARLLSEKIKRLLSEIRKDVPSETVLPPAPASGRPSAPTVTAQTAHADAPSGSETKPDTATAAPAQVNINVPPLATSATGAPAEVSAASIPAPISQPIQAPTVPITPTATEQKKEEPLVPPVTAQPVATSAKVEQVEPQRPTTQAESQPSSLAATPAEPIALTPAPVEFSPADMPAPDHFVVGDKFATEPERSMPIDNPFALDSANVASEPALPFVLPPDPIEATPWPGLATPEQTAFPALEGTAQNAAWPTPDLSLTEPPPPPLPEPIAAPAPTPASAPDLQSLETPRQLPILNPAELAQMRAQLESPLPAAPTPFTDQPPNWHDPEPPTPFPGAAASSMSSMPTDTPLPPPPASSASTGPAPIGAPAAPSLENSTGGFVFDFDEDGPTQFPATVRQNLTSYLPADTPIPEEGEYLDLPTEEPEEIVPSPPAENTVQRTRRSMEQELAELERERYKIQRFPGLTAAERKQRIEALDEQITDLRKVLEPPPPTPLAPVPTPPPFSKAAAPQPGPPRQTVETVPDDTLAHFLANALGFEGAEIISEPEPESAMLPTPVAGGQNQNRRSFLRMPAVGTVQCVAGKWAMGRPVKGKLVDISPDGVAFLTDQLISETDVQLELEGRSRGKLKVNASIRKSMKRDNGLWLIACQFEHRLSSRELAQFVKS